MNMRELEGMIEDALEDARAVMRSADAVADAPVAAAGDELYQLDLKASGLEDTLYLILDRIIDVKHDGIEPWKA